MLSRPRKPPAKRFFPSGSLRFTHQVKLRRSFWNVRSRNRRSRCPRGPVILYTRQQAHACTGGLTSPNANSYAGICPLGCMYHSRNSSTSWSFANSRSEEHTSELQSLAYLVCRLLLEKKKKKKKTD